MKFAASAYAAKAYSEEGGAGLVLGELNYLGFQLLALEQLLSHQDNFLSIPFIKLPSSKVLLSGPSIEF